MNRIVFVVAAKYSAFAHNVAVVVVPAVALFVIRFFGQDPVFVDDSYIFYRYAANWAGGYGLVYNPGEWVEGYSSLLWVLVLSVGARAGASPEVLAPLLGLTLGIGALVIFSSLTSLLLRGSALVRATVTMTMALSPGFAYYAASGMDTVLFTAILLGTILAIMRAYCGGRLGLAIPAFVLLTLVRAEAPLYVAALLLALTVTARVQFAATRLSRARLAVVLLVAGFAIAFTFLGRHIVYGEWLPATVSAKAYTSHALLLIMPADPSTAMPLLRALLNGVRYQLPLLAVCAVPLAFMVDQMRRRHGLPAMVWFVAIPLGVSVVIVTWASGDWMPYHRHLVPVWPLAVLLLAWTVQELSMKLSPARAGVAVQLLAILFVVLAGFLLLYQSAGLARLSTRAPYKYQIGQLLRDLGQPAMLLTNVAGKLPYHAGPLVHVVDLLGLTNQHNAKHGMVWSPTYGRTDYQYSFSLPFDLMVTNNTHDLREFVLFTQRTPQLRTQYKLYTHPDWLAHRFFVLADPRGTVGGRLQQLCACEPLVLDEHLVDLLIVQRDGEGGMLAGTAP